MHNIASISHLVFIFKLVSFVAHDAIWPYNERTMVSISDGIPVLFGYSRESKIY